MPNSKDRSVLVIATHSLRELELSAVTLADKHRIGRVWKALHLLEELLSDVENDDG